jgi:hypothetical protein
VNRILAYFVSGIHSYAEALSGVRTAADKREGLFAPAKLFVWIAGVGFWAFN